MKTTLKIGLVTAAFLLALASCSNVVNPTAVKDSVDTKAVVDERQYIGSKAFIVDNIKAYKRGDGPYKSVQIAVTFNHEIKEETLNNGVTITRLTNASSAYTMPAQNTVTVSEVRIADTVAYYTLDIDWNTAVTTDLYVHVDATKVKAVNGASLNQDKDTKWGEPNDDDYAAVFFLNQNPTTSTSGITQGLLTHKKNLKSAALSGDFYAQLNDNNKVITDFFSVDFASGKKSAENTIVAATVNASTLMNGYTAAEQPGVQAKVAEFLNARVADKSLTFEAYNWEKHEWKTLTLGGPFTYLATDNAWNAPINVPPNNPVRARWEKANEVKLEGLSHYGYPIKLTLDDNEHTVVFPTPPALPAKTVTREGDMWPASDLTATKRAGKVEITLQAPTSFKAFINNNWEAISADKVSANGDVLTKSEFKGFAPGTDNPKYFKCFDASGYRLNIKSVKLVKGVDSNNLQNYPHAFNKIVIMVDTSSTNTSATDTQPASVYISPAVKTVAFVGSYMDGVTSKPYPIPALGFADVQDSNDPEVWGGWLKKMIP